MGKIYVIRNTVNGKVLVGQTITRWPNTRWAQHRWFLRNGSHSNTHLQSAWNKYGEVAFEFEVIEEIDNNDIEMLNLLEIKYIEEHNSLDENHGYNLREGGRSGNMPCAAKKKIRAYWTPERREQRRQQMLEQWEDPDIRKMREEGNRRGGEKMAKEYEGFIDPQGKIYSPVINLSKFCRDHNLMLSHMQSIDNRKRKTHKGWTKYGR